MKNIAVSFFPGKKQILKLESNMGRKTRKTVLYNYSVVLSGGSFWYNFFLLFCCSKRARLFFSFLHLAIILVLSGHYIKDITIPSQGFGSCARYQKPNPLLLLLRASLFFGQISFQGQSWGWKSRMMKMGVKNKKKRKYGVFFLEKKKSHSYNK